jgi:antitoxin YefM
MQTSYRLSVAELDESFLKSVKALFSRPDEEIEITITSARDDTAYLLSSEANRQHLEAALADIKAGGNLAELPIEKLQSLQ